MLSQILSFWVVVDDYLFCSVLIVVNSHDAKRYQIYSSCLQQYINYSTWRQCGWTECLRAFHLAVYSFSASQLLGRFSPFYRPQRPSRLSRGIALLFLRPRHSRCGWGVQPQAPATSTLRKDPVSIVQEAGWAPGPIWTGGKYLLHRDSIPDRPALSHSLYRLSYPAHASQLLSLCKFNKKLLSFCAP